MIMAGVLERAANGGNPRFMVKGGVAPELRLGGECPTRRTIVAVLKCRSHRRPDLDRHALQVSDHEQFRLLPGGSILRRSGAKRQIL
jgi:hypothetical protein